MTQRSPHSKKELSEPGDPATLCDHLPCFSRLLCHDLFHDIISHDRVNLLHRKINSRRRKNERICMHAHALWQVPVPGIHLIQALMCVTPYLITFRYRNPFGDLFLEDLLSLQGSNGFFL